MAWNPGPQVQVARDAAAKLAAADKLDAVDQVIILYVGRRGDNRMLGMATFGQTRELCAAAKKLGDALYDEAWGAMVKEGE